MSDKRTPLFNQKYLLPNPRGRGRAQSLPSSPRTSSSSGVQQKRRESSQPILHSASEKEVTIMAPTALEKLVSKRNMTVAKLKSVMKDTTSALESNPNKRRLQRMLTNLTDAGSLMEDHENELCQLDPDAAVLDEIGDFAEQ